VFAQQTCGQLKWQGRFRSRTLRAMNTSIRPYLDTSTPDATRDLAAKIRSLGTAVTPETIGATIALFAPQHAGVATRAAEAARDLAYGTAERHRLDVFAPVSDARATRPVVLFVHGGGFVGGNKHTPGSPFYDNVGQWAVRNGMIGVTMTYRLAPAHRWPAGSEDVGLAVEWLRQNIGAYGGESARIFVMGQSAGAVHVAGYIARQHSAGSDGWRPAGAVLISGLYDTRTIEKNPLREAYFGEDAGAAASASFLPALASSDVPLMVVLAEYDPRDFQRQAVELNHAYVSQHQRWPRFVQLAGHNHLSTVLGINAPGDVLGKQILEFAAAV
jgi:acetyl esterase/lipase